MSPATLQQLQDAHVLGGATQVVGLSGQTLSTITTVIEAFRWCEGLPGEQPVPAAADAELSRGLMGSQAVKR